MRQVKSKRTHALSLRNLSITHSLTPSRSLLRLHESMYSTWFTHSYPDSRWDPHLHQSKLPSSGKSCNLPTRTSTHDAAYW
jgi:hypothetical protein